VIRIKIFERFYRWWIRTGNDFRNAVIPLFGCFFFTVTIYFLSVFLYEREEKVSFIFNLSKNLKPKYLNIFQIEKNLKNSKKDKNNRKNKKISDLNIFKLIVIIYFYFFK
jgi:hypothetical protein